MIASRITKFLNPLFRFAIVLILLLKPGNLRNNTIRMAKILMGHATMIYIVICYFGVASFACIACTSVNSVKF